MNVRLISITSDPEALIAHIARVSSPSNQDNPEYAKLIAFLIRNHHFSPFEHAFMTVEIKTSRGIAAQLLRHRSFTFQEYSQRYSEATEFESVEIRKQATKNRQSSLEVFNPVIFDSPDPDRPELCMYASDYIASAISYAETTYRELLEAGIAKEVARFVLPLATQTTIYMTGSARSWIHYLQLRTKEDVQKEHRLIAVEIEKLFDLYFPLTSAALNTLAQEEKDKQMLYDMLIKGLYT